MGNTTKIVPVLTVLTLMWLALDWNIGWRVKASKFYAAASLYQKLFDKAHYKIIEGNYNQEGVKQFIWIIREIEDNAKDNVPVPPQWLETKLRSGQTFGFCGLLCCCCFDRKIH